MNDFWKLIESYHQKSILFQLKELGNFLKSSLDTQLEIRIIRLPHKTAKRRSNA